MSDINEKPNEPQPKKPGNALPIILLLLAVIVAGVIAYVVKTGVPSSSLAPESEKITADGTSDVPESSMPMPPAEDQAAIPAPPGETPLPETTDTTVADAGEAAPIDVQKALAIRAIGNPNAPVKIQEFFSLTCSHCAHFHNDVLPLLKSKYIDTGKVYFVFNDFPLNDPALKAAVAARCLPEDRYEGFLALLMKTQEVWAGGLNYISALKQNAKLAGMNEATFDACQNSKEIQVGMAQAMQTGKDKWKIEATPTFIINGVETLQGAQPLEEFERVFRKVTNDAVGAVPAAQ